MKHEPLHDDDCEYKSSVPSKRQQLQREIEKQGNRETEHPVLLTVHRSNHIPPESEHSLTLEKLPRHTTCKPP
jgi:hypothetical protein